MRPRHRIYCERAPLPPGFDLFPQPWAGRRAKWWSVEVRPERRLRPREVRWLASQHELEGAAVGQDGIVCDQWWNSWPGTRDSWSLLDIIRRLGVPALVRVAPFGRDCPGADCPNACREFDASHRCIIGSAFSADPVWTKADWKRVDPRGTGGGCG
jgi:hypothetical protein